MMTRTYWAQSILNSRTFWVNTAILIVGILTATDVITVIPKSILPFTTAIVASLNIYLRTITVRPVAFIPPGDVKPIVVEKLDKPAKAISD